MCVKGLGGTKMSDAESRKTAMDCIEDGILSAMNTVKSEDRGLISDVYDIYKDFNDNSLSSRNVKYAIADETAGLLALNSADSGNLTKRDYYLESKERMINLTMSRLRNSGIKVTETRKKEIYEDIERNMRKNLEMVKDLSQVSSIKQIMLNADDATFERLMSKYVRVAEQMNQPRSMEDAPISRPPLPEFSVPQQYNTSETINFEEVYLNERGVGFNPDYVQNFDHAKNEMSVAQGAYNKYQSFLYRSKMLNDISEPLDFAEGLDKLYQDYYAASPEPDAAYQNLDAAVQNSGTNCWLVRGPDNSILIDTSVYPDDASKTKALKQILATGQRLQEQQLNKVLNGKNLESYITNYQNSYQKALGSQNSNNLAQAMVEDNLEVIDNVANVGTMTGMALTVAGGVVSFAAPPAAPVGMAISKAGTGLSMASMGARSVAGYTEAFTRDNFDPEELVRRNKDLAMDVAGFAIGSAAGATGGRFARNMVNNGTGRVAAMIADKGTDYTLSLAGDLAMMGALQTQQSVGDLAENNLMGIAVSAVAGARHGLRYGSMMDNSPSHMLGLKRVTLENGRYKVTSTLDLEREHIAARNREQAKSTLLAAGIDENNPQYQQYYAQALSVVHSGRQFSENEAVTSQRLLSELQSPDITPQKLRDFAMSYRDEVIEKQQKNASGSIFDHKDESAAALKGPFQNTLRSGVELRRQINPDYPEIFYNDKGQLEDIILDLSANDNSAVSIINGTVKKYKKFNVDFDTAANQFIIKGKPVNVQKFFKGKQEQLDKFLNKIMQEPESFDATDRELFEVIAAGDYAKFNELKMIRGKGGDKRNLALRNALNDEILFDRFGEELRGKPVDLQTIAENAKILSEDYGSKSSIINKESERGKISSSNEDLSLNEIDRIEFSVRPSELAKQSTYQNWKSCMNAVGCNHRYVDDSIGQGSIIAYGFNSNNPQKKISRLLIHPYVDESGKTLYAVNDRLYGESNSGFVDAVHNFTNQLNDGKDGIFTFNNNKKAGTDGLYNDNNLVGNEYISIAKGDIDFNKINSETDYLTIDWSQADNVRISQPKEDLDLSFAPAELLNKMDLSACEGRLKISSSVWEQLDKSKMPVAAKIDKTFSYIKGNEDTLDLSGISEHSVALKSNKISIESCDVTLPENLENLSITGNWYGKLSEFQGNLETDSPANLKQFKKLKSLTLKNGYFSDYDLKTEVEDLKLISPREVAISEKSTIKNLAIKDHSKLSSVVIFNNPELSAQIINQETFSRLSFAALDDYNQVSSLLSKENPKLEGFGFKGSIGDNGLDFSNCPNLKEVGFIDVSNENAVIDFSNCKKLEKIECDGENKLKRIIVPAGFDKANVSGLEGVEILTPGEVKAKDLLSSIRSPGIARSDLPENSDKMNRYLVLRGITSDTQIHHTPAGNKSKEATQQRIQDLYIRKERMVAMYG